MVRNVVRIKILVILNGRYHLGDVSVDVMIILKCILEKCVKERMGFNCRAI
jgi:hypothetical protein